MRERLKEGLAKRFKDISEVKQNNEVSDVS
jgi:hypothetical protein